MSPELADALASRANSNRIRCGSPIAVPLRLKFEEQFSLSTRCAGRCSDGHCHSVQLADSKATFCCSEGLSSYRTPPRTLGSPTLAGDKQTSLCV